MGTTEFQPRHSESLILCWYFIQLLMAWFLTWDNPNQPSGCTHYGRRTSVWQRFS